MYLPNGGTRELDMGHDTGDFTISWFNPRTAGTLIDGGATSGGKVLKLESPDAKGDWVALIRQK